MTECFKCEYGYDDDEAMYCVHTYTPARSPLCWPGGKFYLANKLIPLFPEHTTYVEPFGGAGHVLFKKKPSKVEIYNDIDGRLVNFFRIVRSKAKCVELCTMLEQSLYSREVFNDCINSIHDETLSDVEKAYAFALINKQSFGGLMETWGTDVMKSKQTKAYYNLPKLIDKAHERLKNVQIEQSSFEYILKRYDRQCTFFYLDPPYDFAGKRTSRIIYDNEMTIQDHERLVDMLIEIKGKAMLSGYDTPTYTRLGNAGWRKVHVCEQPLMMSKRVGEKRIKRQEFVWANW